MSYVRLRLTFPRIYLVWDPLKLMQIHRRVLRHEVSKSIYHELIEASRRAWPASWDYGFQPLHWEGKTEV
jgi:hypothetical protein